MIFHRKLPVRNTSLRDLKLADTLSHLSELEMINPANDSLVKAALEIIGYDITKRIDYVPSFHRDRQHKKAVGFQVIGEYSTDPKYKHFLDAFDRIVVCGMTDPSLARELAEIAGKRFTYTNDDEADTRSPRVPDARYYSDEKLKELGFTGFDDDNSEDSFLAEHGGAESDCDMISSQIAALQSLKIAIRGE